MRVLNKLRSQGLQEAINRLEDSSDKASSNYLIGSTVQPVVNVNKPLYKWVTGSFMGNATYTLNVPGVKVWRIHSGQVKIVCDATVVNRYIYVRKLFSFDSSVFALIGNSGAITAGVTGYLYFNRSVYVGQAALGYMFNVFENDLIPGDALYFYVGGGVAGDVVTISLQIAEYDLEPC